MAFDSARTETSGSGSRLLVLVLAVCSFGLGCGAVFPELTTPVRNVPPGYHFDPPPPADLVYLAFARATIPSKTRDGRAWDSVGGSLPDAFGKVIVNSKDLIVTPVDPNTLSPTWPNQKRGNYRIAVGSTVRVELWDSNPLNNHPICSEEIRNFHEQVSNERPVEVTCDSGAYLELVAEPAHGRVGLGLFYEIRTEQVFVTRVISESPAARAGIVRGEEILQIMGESARGMEQGRVRSLMNANVSTGLRLRLRSSDGSEREIVLKDGPLYPLLSEDL